MTRRQPTQGDKVITPNGKPAEIIDQVGYKGRYGNHPQKLLVRYRDAVTIEGEGDPVALEAYYRPADLSWLDWSNE